MAPTEEAFNCAWPLPQISVSPEAVTDGKDLTVIVTLSFAEQPSGVFAVTKYFVVTSGEATGLFMPALLRPAGGIQE